MAVKAINNLAKPDKIIPTLLVFRAYPQITKIDTSLPSITKKAKAIHTAIKEVCYLQAKHQVKNALAIRNSPNTIFILNLPILSEVHIWCEKDG